MKVSRIVTAVLVAGSASFGFLPLAHASTETQVVNPSVEAWYQPNPTCTLAVGCVGLGSLPAAPPAPIPLTAFPAGSMHVAVNGGQETARTYLSFSLPLFDGTLTGANMDVPLDLAQADGSVTPENAVIQVCSFTGAINAANGSMDQPPMALCASSAKASYVAAPAPHLHVDLTPLLDALSSGAGLVLLPDAASVAPTDAWHVVFSSHDRTDAGKTPPARMTVTLDTTPAPTYSPPPVTTPVGTSVVPPPLSPVGLPPAAVQPPAVSNPAPQLPAQPVPQARTITVGYAYPTVWLLPLAFLLVVPVVARTLTQDLTPIA